MGDGRKLGGRLDESKRLIFNRDREGGRGSQHQAYAYPRADGHLATAEPDCYTVKSRKEVRNEEEWRLGGSTQYIHRCSYVSSDGTRHHQLHGKWPYLVLTKREGSPRLPSLFLALGHDIGHDNLLCVVEDKGRAEIRIGKRQADVLEMDAADMADIEAP